MHCCTGSNASNGARTFRPQSTRLEAYGDAAPTGELRREQALRRAEAVAAQLIGDGVPSDRVTTRGLAVAAPLDAQGGAPVRLIVAR